MSHDSISHALAALRDVAGVHGSFVLRPTGELLGKDLPAVFHDDLFVEVGARLSRFVETMAAGPHWMRVFLGALDGKHMGSEVLVDGEVWAPGQQLLDAHAWTYPAGYASLRHLLIALPRKT